MHGARSLRRPVSLYHKSLLGSSIRGMAAAAQASTTGSFSSFAERVDLSYVRTLTEDPDAAAFAPNRDPREVRSGHFVRVAPTPLKSPYLVAVSDDYAAVLGLDASEASTHAFIRVFSGDLSGAPRNFEPRGWATPYALSIYGRPQLPPGTGPRGDGYGDGRAISIAEVRLPVSGAADGGGGGPGGGEGGAPARAELQLKGGGRTPFCRGADGAAVLRSSVREFLASEANAALGVPTTRALCLVASAEEEITRPWYSGSARGGEPDVLVRNRRAITTRAARSFLRVGQFELYGRRAARGEAQGRADLEALARHALEREYPAFAPAPGAPLGPAILGMLGAASRRFAALASEWIRVGYVQSNFNGDNCLVGGATLDYGPFGFLERYDPAWGMWVGAGAHFAFMNQPSAAAMNFAVLAQVRASWLRGKGAALSRHVPRVTRLIRPACTAVAGPPPLAARARGSARHPRGAPARVRRRPGTHVGAEARPAARRSRRRRGPLGAPRAAAGGAPHGLDDLLAPARPAGTPSGRAAPRGSSSSSSSSRRRGWRRRRRGCVVASRRRCRRTAGGARPGVL